MTQFTFLFTKKKSIWLCNSERSIVKKLEVGKNGEHARIGI
jgi:hypothetical protein